MAIERRRQQAKKHQPKGCRKAFQTPDGIEGLRFQSRFDLGTRYREPIRNLPAAEMAFLITNERQVRGAERSLLFSHAKHPSMHRSSRYTANLRLLFF